MNEFVRIRKIGEGTFGKALLVKSKKDGMQYVIKEINISKMAVKDREESRREVKVLSKMKHPNIVSYIKSFEETGNLYIVMDYCDGGDLYQRINSQRGVYFTEDQVLDWFVQIGLAIKHVHDRKILHRDIKTQNIFLTRRGAIKLGDFGIARVLKNTMELARTCIGTPYYLSPEICENRPYNNKSDIWSLGCVLYEMLTLKHAFEAGNMKNLVLKIIRGSYPPVPPRYSADARLLVARLFKRNPHDRPSINTVLKQPIVQNRIKKFLSEEITADEFGHTVLHRQPFSVPSAQKFVPGRPVKPVQAPKKISKPAAKYGVSVANKGVRKPSNDVYSHIRKATRPSDREAEKARECDAREKRRQQHQREQEDNYNKMMNDIQKQRWQKQQMAKINKAKEQNWRNSGNILSPEKEVKSNDGDEHGVVNKQHAAMKKYQNPGGKENRPRSVYDAGHRPTPAWQHAARQAEVNRVRAAEAGDRARVLEEFWQRKREALANKNRGGQQIGGPSVKSNNLAVAPAPYIPAPRHDDVGIGQEKHKNPAEQDYLSRLEAIRKQNYRERLEIQHRMAKVRAPVPKPSSSGENGDPRVDPDARRKKIAALKAQADERAAMLKKQLEVRRQAVFDRAQHEVKPEIVVNEEKKVKRVYQRPASAVENKPDERPAVPAVGLETALKQVGATRLFRSHSEGDLSKVIEESVDKMNEDEEIQRKQWAGKPFTPLMFPLEATASAMEATTANDVVMKPAMNNVRSKWNLGGKTQLVSALGKANIQPGTFGMPAGESSETLVLQNEENTEEKKTVSYVIGGSAKPSMGVTVSVSKESFHPSSFGTSANLGATVVKSSVDQTEKHSVVPPTNVGRPLPPAPASKHEPSRARPLPTPDIVNSEEKQQENDVTTVDIDKELQTSSGKDKPCLPIKAWEEESQSMTCSQSQVSLGKFEQLQDQILNLQRIYKASPEYSNEDELPHVRESYQEFLHSLRRNDSPEQTPLFTKVNANKEASNEDDDVKVQDVSSEEEQSLYHTAEAIDVSPVALNSGRYDTDSKRLRTCSLPDLRLLFQTVAEDTEASAEEDIKPSFSEGRLQVFDDIEEKDFEDDPSQEVDIDIACNNDESDDENQDYISMLASMEDVLVSDARSPSPIKMVRNLETSCKSDEDSDPNDDSDSQSSTPLPLNEDWDSGDSEDERDESKHEDKESVFARLEVSRKLLEDELGFCRFMKVYKYIQSIQENDDDDVNVGVSPAPEISDLLGAEYEHLYPKILYLVMADSAYCEDND